MRVNRSARCHCGDSQGTWPLAPNLLQPLDADRRKLSMHQTVAMPQACSCFQWSDQDIPGVAHSACVMTFPKRAERMLN